MATYPPIAAGRKITGNLLRSMLSGVVVKESNTDREDILPALDPELQINLGPGTYLVEMHLMPAATTDAGFRTEWRVPAGSSGYKKVLGPGSTASNGSADNIAMRAGVHNYETPIRYAGVRNSSTSAYVVEESSIITVAATGTVGLAWAQWAAVPSPSRLAVGSVMRVTRLG